MIGIRKSRKSISCSIENVVVIFGAPMFPLCTCLSEINLYCVATTSMLLCNSLFVLTENELNKKKLFTAYMPGQYNMF